ncbi:MAG: RNA-directed DNA polymerase [Bacilli bacterium]
MNENFTPMNLRLVPAPKNSSWSFKDANNGDFEQWGCGDEQRLRPLAHISIRDQTLATAVMLCLADAVETMQGPSDESDFLKAHKQRIYSYGNRLHCDWVSMSDNRKRAKFGWGNSRCYRQYYEDYQKFLMRPKLICQHYATRLAPGQSLFVLSFDLKSFYDGIDKSALINQLENIYHQYVREYNISPTHQGEKEFWKIVRNIFKWNWDSSDDTPGLFDLKTMPNGLPQGLVSSGFLSNAYLLEFDRLMGSHINKTSTQSFILRDYCRYVDDVRVVVEVRETQSVYQVKSDVTQFVDSLLSEHKLIIGATERLQINEQKTKITSYKQLSIQTNVSALMAMYQGILSGTPDADSLRQAAGGLEGLLKLSEQIKSVGKNEPLQLDLARISNSNADVRDDTLKRYAASRIAKSLRMRRGMTDPSAQMGHQDAFLENVSGVQVLDHEFETTARKLISYWAENPSLTVLLRLGLDLFPDPELLEPVIDALTTKLFSTTPSDIKSIQEVKAIEYVLADLFRAGAVDIGYRSDIEYPVSADRKAFRSELATFAKKILTDRPNSPWYVKQQVALFLAGIGDFIVDLSGGADLDRYNLLRKAQTYQIISGQALTDSITVALVAQQLTPEAKKFAKWFVEMLQNVNSEEEQKQLVSLVAMNRPDLIREIRSVRKARSAKWLNFIPAGIDSSQKFELFDGETVSLLRIIRSDTNPFKQENALLLLAQKILKVPDIENKLKSGLSASQIQIRCARWEDIQQLPTEDRFLNVECDSNIESDERYRQPSWVDKEFVWLYGLGRILRSCLTGEYDFTTSSYLVRENTGRYRGLHSTWYSRRFGLINSPSGLLDEQYPVSSWLSEFLLQLLQWPGIEIYRDSTPLFNLSSKLDDLRRVIEERIQHQRGILGKLSRTPMYELPTISSHSDNRLFRVAIVQTALPKMDDYNVKDPTHWTAAYRAQHSAHIATVCSLVRQHLNAWSQSQSNQKSDGAIDLIVFPELTIHPDDVWRLRQLSDVTKSSIFAGLTFLKRKSDGEVINQATWILRYDRPTGRERIEVRQGKKFMTTFETKAGIKGDRPFQILVNFKKGENEIIRATGVICYDATDLTLAADLRDISDIFVIAAMNKDVQTFDNMVGALQYHMYQPVILANTGEFGGSTAQAPFTKQERLIAHVHGSNQVVVSIFELDPAVFKTAKQPKKPVEVKTAPAGYNGRK